MNIVGRLCQTSRESKEMKVFTIYTKKAERGFVTDKVLYFSLFVWFPRILEGAGGSRKQGNATRAIDSQRYKSSASTK
jgi:hypothetical protein